MLCWAFADCNLRCPNQCSAPISVSWPWVFHGVMPASFVRVTTTAANAQDWRMPAVCDAMKPAPAGNRRVNSELLLLCQDGKNVQTDKSTQGYFTSLSQRQVQAHDWRNAHSHAEMVNQRSLKRPVHAHGRERAVLKCHAALGYKMTGHDWAHTLILVDQ